MNYYKKHIGDYAKKAGRLSILQHGIYNLLIDACYDRERFPTRDEAVDWVWASSPEEVDGVDLVLRKFFTQQDDGTYVQQRIEDEICAYRAQCATNKRIAEAREGKRNETTNTNNESSGANNEASTRRERRKNEAPPNHKPITNNHKPKDKTLSASDVAHFERFWEAYPRKKDKLKAQKAFAKLKVTDDLMEKIMAGLVAEKRERIQCQNQKKFYPEWKYASAWLNGHCWENEPDQIEPDGQPYDPFKEPGMI